MGQLINGREISQSINESVKNKIEKLESGSGKVPKMVSVIATDSDDAHIYMKMQKRAAENAGIEFETHKLDNNITQDTLISEVEKLNADDSVTSVIVQKPLPEGISHSKIVSVVSPAKDAEGLHPFNLGKILRREADIVPCTPGAVMKILSFMEIELYGKEVVILGHSAIVGKPLSLMMLNETATTTVCHIGTSEKGDIISHAQKADILVVAVGCPEMVKADWVKEGVVVVDVGINNTANGIVGDVAFDEVKEKAAAITPVPGGVGPITVSILMRNVLRSFAKQISL